MLFDRKKVEDATRLFLEGIGEDINREGLKETPKRVADMWEEFIKARVVETKEFISSATLNNGMVLVTNIPLFSFCEHHLIPFYGRCDIAYVPTKIDNGYSKVIGISKLARIVRKYASMPQIQERLTRQIHDEIFEYTKADGVIVRVSATHLCMVSRGARAVGSITTTLEYSGLFKDPVWRQDFFNLVVKE